MDKKTESPAKPKAPRVWPTFLTFVILLLGILGLGLLSIGVGAYLHLFFSSGAWPDFHEVESQIKREIQTLSVITIGVSAFATFLFILCVSLSAGFLSPVSLRDRLRIRRTGVGFLTIILAMLGMLGLNQSIDSIICILDLRAASSIGMTEQAITEASWTMFIILLFSLSALGLGEELFFRGFMQTRLKERWGRWPAIVIASVAFGLVHMDPVHSFAAFLMGLFLGWITEKTGSILVSTVIHVANNALVSVMTRYYPGCLSDRWNLALLAAGAAMGMGMIVLLHRWAHPGIEPASPE